MKRTILAITLMVLAALVLLHRLHHREDFPANSAAPPSQLVPLGQVQRVESRGRAKSLEREANRFETRTPVSPAQLSDGEWILASPLVESRMVLWAFTNAGVPMDQAKCLLRPALAHLYAGAVYKERISQMEVKELEEMKSIRENDGYSDQDKIGFMLVKAAAFRSSREKWEADRGEWMRDFSTWVQSTGVEDPQALRRDLLMIQPATPPPDPKP